jgi:hypothetical protein
MAKQVFAAMLVGLCAAGCAGAASGRGDTEGIEGRVTLGPTCPVEIQGSPCPDRPFATGVVVTDGSGRAVAEVRSSDDGSFRVALPPGTYTVVAKHVGPGGSKPVRVIVRSARFTRVVVRVDSGIR